MGSEMWSRVLPWAVRVSAMAMTMLAAITLPTMEAMEPAQVLPGLRRGASFALAEGAADVEGCDIAGPDADHEEEDEGGAVFLFPEEGNEGERVGDVDEAEEALRGVGQNLNEGSAKTVPGKEDQREAAKDGELRLRRGR